MTSEDVSSLHTRSHTCACTHKFVCIHECAHVHIHMKHYNTLIGGTVWQAVSTAKRGNLGCSCQVLVMAFGLVEAGGGGSGSFAHSRTIYFLVTRRNVRSTQRWALNGYLKMAQDNLTLELQHSKVLCNHRNSSRSTSLVETVT